MLNETALVKTHEITLKCRSTDPARLKISKYIISMLEDKGFQLESAKAYIHKTDIAIDRDLPRAYKIFFVIKAVSRQAVYFTASLISKLTFVEPGLEINSVYFQQNNSDPVALPATKVEVGRSEDRIGPSLSLKTNYYYCINPKTDVRKLCHSRNIPKQPYITECVFTDNKTGHQGIGLSVCSFKEKTPIKSEGRKHAARRAFEALRAKVNIEPVTSSTLKLILPVLKACKYPCNFTYMGQYVPMAQDKTWTDPVEKPYTDKVKIYRPPDISTNSYPGHTGENKFAAALNFWFKEGLYEGIQVKEKVKTDKPSGYQPEIWPTRMLDFIR